MSGLKRYNLHIKRASVAATSYLRKSTSRFPAVQYRSSLEDLKRKTLEEMPNFIRRGKLVRDVTTSFGLMLRPSLRKLNPRITDDLGVL
jgi:hypothetical protein